MTNARLRIALIAAVAALLLLAGPAAARVQRPSQYARITRPVAAAPAVSTPPAAPPPVVAAPGEKPDPQETESDRPVRARPPVKTKSSSQPPSQPGTGAGSPSPESTLGPAGSLRLTGSSAVALTFDDGPDPVNTPKILDLLAQHGVKATFCLVGFKARDHPDLVKRIAEEGHTFCNHSWQHLLNLASRPVDYINWDLSHTNEVIRSIVPGAKIPYFRAPGGNFTRNLVTMAHGYGMQSIYWKVDPWDWNHKGLSDGAHIARVIADVQRNTVPGAIVLSHDNGQPDTIEAYKTLIPWLKARFTLAALPT
jgi:peptidoglycan-N-acetylglucosamine deacetylase